MQYVVRNTITTLSCGFVLSNDIGQQYEYHLCTKLRNKHKISKNKLNSKLISFYRNKIWSRLAIFVDSVCWKWSCKMHCNFYLETKKVNVFAKIVHTSIVEPSWENSKACEACRVAPDQWLILLLILRVLSCPVVAFKKGLKESMPNRTKILKVFRYMRPRKFKFYLVF